MTLNKAKIDRKSTSSFKSEIFSLSLVILIAFLIRTFCFEIFYVPTGSMKATILEGDYIFTTKYDYGYSIYSIPFHPNIFTGRIFATQPQRGDVIIMRPPHNMQERYIKRLIGLPGDKIQIIDDLIFINDVPIQRREVGPYSDEQGHRFRKFIETLPEGRSYFSYKTQHEPSISNIAVDHSNFAPYIVEPGHYFFIGDNRDNSGDSRYQLGSVPFQNLIAKGRFVLFSTPMVLWEDINSILDQIKRFGQWIASIRFSRFFTSLYETDV